MADNWKKGIVICADAAADAAVAAKLDPQVRALLESNRADAVEELTLGRIEGFPYDLKFFVPLLRHFVKNNKSETAQTFFDLLIDAYRTGKAEEEELSLLRALLVAWPEAPKVRTMLAEKLRSLYGDTPNAKRLIEHCRIFESADPRAAFQTFEYWLRYEEGRGVYMTKKGTGRIREINILLGTVRTIFPGSTDSLSFKLDEAARLLEPLPPGHFLLATIDHSTELRQLAATDGGELLRRLFASVNRPIALGELKEMLSTIVSSEQWSSWWPHVRRDRRITVKTGNLCSWNESAENAEAAILEQFAYAPVSERIAMVRHYADRSSALVSAMAAQLVKDAGNERLNNPAQTLELLLAIEKMPSAEGHAMLAELIRRPDAAEAIRALRNRSSRKRALTLLRDYRQDWPALYAVLIRSENDRQLLSLLYESLREKNSALLDEIVSETITSPAKAEYFFVWLCREMNTRNELKRFAGWQFLLLIMQLLANNALKKQQSAVKKLFDEESVFHQAARNLEPDQAQQLIALLERDTALEDYRRDAMLKDLRAWYPQTEGVNDKTFYVSTKALKIRQEEFAKLTSVDIPQNTEEIIKARAHGDLRENFEYHAARARQEMLSSRAKTLHDELQLARPIDVSKVDPSKICIGTSVRLSSLDTGEIMTIAILGPWDSDPARNIFSYMAPAVNSLLGKHRGERVLFNEKQLVIEDIAIAASE
jgi:transcription elongation factor GreA